MRQNLTPRLANIVYGPCGIITAVRGNDYTKLLSLWSDLDSLGYSVAVVVGKYDGVTEVGYAVPHLSKDDALELGRLYEQECVLLVGEGMLYMNTGEVVPQVGVTIIESGSPDNYTVCHDVDEGGNTVFVCFRVEF